MPDYSIDTISAALQNPEITAAFKQHLKGEFSTENIEFHEEMTQFAKNVQDPRVSDAQLRNMAKDIFDKYVTFDASKQVNVSSAQVNRIQEAMKGLGGASRDEIGGVLNEAHKEIVGLMDKDSFARFQKTDAYTKAVEKVSETLDASEVALEQLQARERQLKLNPSLADKAKAMMTSGGMVTLIRDVEKQREALEQQIKERTQTLPVLDKGEPKQTAPKVAAPPPLASVGQPPSTPLELEAGVVGRGRSNAQDGSGLLASGPSKASVREMMGGKDASKVGQQKSVGVSSSDGDASKMSVKDKIKFFEGSGGGSAAPPKRGVK